MKFEPIIIDGILTADPNAIIFHSASSEKNIKVWARCIKSHPPMSGTGHELEFESIVPVSGLSYRKELHTFAIFVPLENAHYDYMYFEPVDLCWECTGAGMNTGGGPCKVCSAKGYLPYQNK